MMIARILQVVALLTFTGAAQAGEAEEAELLQVTARFYDLHERGDYKDAIPYGERSIELGAAIFGVNSPEVVTLMNNLTSCLMAAWEYPRAIALGRDALARVEAGGRGSDPSAMRTLLLLARAYADDDLPKGEQALTRALRIGETAYGKDDPRLGDIIRELGHNAFSSPRPLRARRFYERAVKVTENGPPEFAESRALALFELGRFEMAVGNHRSAEKHFLHVLSVRAALRPSDPLQLSARTFLIELYDRMGQPDRATEHVHHLATLQPQAEFNETGWLLKVVPEYPAFVKLEEGKVIIAADIDEMGRVVNARVEESRMSSPFDSAALKSVERWRYKPRVVDGKFVRRDDIRITVIFAANKR
ncbi:MAG: TonB family protein [Sphingomonadales bacterium]